MPQDYWKQTALAGLVFQPVHWHAYFVILNLKQWTLHPGPYNTVVLDWMCISGWNERLFKTDWQFKTGKNFDIENLKYDQETHMIEIENWKGGKQERNIHIFKRLKKRITLTNLVPASLLYPWSLPWPFWCTDNQFSQMFWASQKS